ncbi:hypothetical protein [Roseovarius sp. THAF9]|uniref:hypothetical protein n=1 Tax=Roseovarius sp. THAF9 TaxID=2587847 RepID=UPI0012678BAE|nr:hypothetical protein [Roseovarius sp. THAF9]
MVTELAIVLRSAVERIPRFRSLGFYVPFKWAVVHLDDDPDLARKVLSAANFVPDTEGRWVWRRGLYPLSKVTDMNVLGDTLVSVVDFHRPISAA